MKRFGSRLARELDRASSRKGGYELGLNFFTD